MATLNSIAIKALLATGLAAGATPSGAEDHRSTVKGIYLDRDHHPTENGMRFDILLEHAAGGRAEAPVTQEFHSGDRIWLRMDVRNQVYVYVMNRTLSGGEKGIIIVRDDDRQRLPPAAELPRLVFGPEKALAGKSRRIPERKAMIFDQHPGIEKLYVVLSPQPLGIENMFDASGRLLSTGANRETVNDLNEKLATWSANADTALPEKDPAKGIVLDNYSYCVGRTPNAPLMVEITLRHTN
jgi:hypothetical protein